MITIVVCAAVVERDGRLLITRRQQGVHLEGYWEFPGGKCDEGEALDACLARELREELGVGMRVGEEVFTTVHEYPDRRIELHFLACEIAGVPSILHQLPLVTYLGWNVVATGFYRNQICAFTGGYVPFAKTPADRIANNDPRPSLRQP